MCDAGRTTNIGDRCDAELDDNDRRRVAPAVLRAMSMHFQYQEGVAVRHKATVNPAIKPLAYAH